MNQYPRKPAVIVLAVAAVVAAVFLVAWGRVEAYYKQKSGGHTIEAMEQRIAEEKKAGRPVTPQTWLAYGQLLMDDKKYDQAASAFKEVLEVQPFNREAKFQRGLALAQSGQADAFYQFQKDLVYSEAKLAVELFERVETQRYQGDERFSALAKEAKNQAMD
jgi:cytochrome c-type biogenesis protein CcmH/NrfG